ncbi:MAG: hypothetical protein L3K26_12975, partial [Candidatus Hydrogenedentes bacterium]|nr:hypothetical protein [Candidatus Hydrogenedentota bacterium]
VGWRHVPAWRGVADPAGDVRRGTQVWPTVVYTVCSFGVRVWHGAARGRFFFGLGQGGWAFLPDITRTVGLKTHWAFVVIR